MSSSFLTRRRLLASASGAVLGRFGATAGVLEGLPGFRRKDPRIQTSIYGRADAMDLAGRTIAIPTFPAQQGGKPAPPDFAPFLGRALTWAFPGSLVELAAEPGGGAEILIQGRIELFHRMGAQGLKVVVSAAVFDISTGEEYVLWNGTKKADWVRRFPTDDCLLLLADDFVETWSAPPG